MSSSSYLLIEATGRVAVIAVAFSIASGVKALASVLRVWIEQSSRTRRLGKALEGSTDWPRIIMALSQLERTGADKPACETDDGTLPAHRRATPRVLILHDKRRHDRHGN